MKRFLAFVLVGLVSFSGLSQAAGKPRTKGIPALRGGSVVVPVKAGIYDSSEGTVDVEISLNYDFGSNPLPPELSKGEPFPIMRVCLDDARQKIKMLPQFSISTYCAQGEDAFLFRTSMGYKWQDEMKTIKVPAAFLMMNKPNSPIDLRCGEWHRLTCTWKRTGESLLFSLYFDGKQMSRVKYPYWPEGDVTGVGTLQVGHPAMSEGCLRRLVFFSKELTAEEIAGGDGSIKTDQRITFSLDAQTLDKTTNLSTTKWNSMLDPGSKRGVPRSGARTGFARIQTDAFGPYMRFYK